MSKYSEYNLMRLSEKDDEDAFDVADIDSDEIDALFSSDTDTFIKAYKAYYDDVKTSKNVYKEDWWFLHFLGDFWKVPEPENFKTLCGSSSPRQEYGFGDENLIYFSL